MSVQAAGPDVLAAVRERYGCYNRHDFDAMEAMYHPDEVFDTSRVFPGERPRRGIARADLFPDREAALAAAAGSDG